MNRTTRTASLLLAFALVLTSVLGAGMTVRPASAAELPASVASQLRQEQPTPPPAEEPEQPVEEAQPEQPAEPPQPEQPVEPSPEPQQPPQPEQPVAPVQPVEPAPPVQPELPVAPVAPVQPIAPLEPAIAINIPVEGEVTSAVEVVVVGVGQGLPENSVVVQAKDASGKVLDGQPITIKGPLGGAGEWRTTLRPNVEPGTPGTIEAFSQSPATGEVIAKDMISVVFGAPGPAPEPTPAPTQPPPVESAIRINIPVEGETTSHVEVVVVGDGVSLPENGLVVQALDAGGAVLDQSTTTVNAPLGGAGEWRTILRPNVEPGTSGSIYAFSTSPKDGSIVAQVNVNVTFGTALPQPTPTPVPPPPAETTVKITIPVNGETTSNQEVVVVGLGSGLPENNVIVEALDSRGRTLDKRATAVDADLGGEGEWRTTVYPNVAPGTQGRIVAYSTSPKTGNIIAQDAVVVTYGQYTPPSDITIKEPHNGAVLRTDQLIGVSGTAQNVFENNVVVRVVSTGGSVLAEQPATADNKGRWSVDLRVPQVNTYAQIIAFSTSPVDGSVDAYDQVSVELVGPQPTPPPQPHIKIASPPNNAVVNTTHGFSVFGSASGTFENNVVVRVLDNQGRTLRQIATRATEDGSWNVFIHLLITNGSTGSIYAFSTSPKDGSIEADDRVNVTFTSGCQPRTDWPVYVVQPGDTLFSIAQRTGSTVGELVIANCISNPNLITVGENLRVPRMPGEVEVIVPPEVVIVSPDVDEVLSVERPVIIEGEGAGITEGNVKVRALDNMGNVLDERRVAVTVPTDQDGTWLWEVDLDLFDAVPGSRGTILAYATSLGNGTILAADTRSVIYGAELTQPWITIETPIPYAQVAEDGIVAIVGRGGGLFENNVVVEVQDDVGNVLSIAPSTVDTDEIGGSGFWEMTFAIDYVGRGFIVAYSTNPEDGSRVAEAKIDVYYGDPETLDEYVVVTHPLPNTLVTGAAPVLSAAGYAGGIDPESLRIVVMDANSRIIMTLPALVNSETGFWSVNLAGPLPVTKDQKATIHAISGSGGSGAVSATDVVPIQVQQPAVTGYITYLVRSALPPDAVARVMVQNISIADAPPEVTMLGEQFIVNPGQVPIPFAVKYNPADVDRRVSYGITARIEDGSGQLLFINKETIQVLTQGYPSRNVEVLVEPVP